MRWRPVPPARVIATDSTRPLLGTIAGSPLCGILLSESAVVRTVGASVSEVVRREEGEGERARGRTYQFGEGAPFSPEAFVLRGGDELRVRCTASQAAALRRGKAPGLRILNESARLLEQLWERRCVVEVVVGRECALRGAPIPLAGHTWLQHYSACPLGLVRPSQPIPAGDHAPAARQRRRSSVLLTAKPRRGSSRPGGATRAAAQPRSVLEVGDVVLLETHAAFSAMHGGGSGDFVLVREVDAGLGSVRARFPLPRSPACSCRPAHTAAPVRWFSGRRVPMLPSPASRSPPWSPWCA